MKTTWTYPNRNKNKAEDLAEVTIAARYALTDLFESARLRIKRRKCAVSGCEIPARAKLGRGMLTEPWYTCGVHRKPISDLLNRAQTRYADTVRDGSRAFTLELVDGLDDLGDHSKEIALAI